MPTSLPPTLLLMPVFEALDAWAADPVPARAETLCRAISGVGSRMGIEVGGLSVDAPPLPALRASGLGGPGPDHVLRSADGDELGAIAVTGDERQVRALVHALEILFSFARERARADRSARQLRALEAAVRGIRGTLDRGRVLQLIADEVRQLASARYAAIAIVDREGLIVQFVPSGMTDAQRAAIGEIPRGRGLLGVSAESRTIRIPDVSADPRHRGFPPNHPVMRAFLGVPIRIGDEAVGRLYLADKIGADEFSDEDETLVETFALHAGLAIEQARLHDQVRRLAIFDERDRISRDLHDSSIQAIYAQSLSLEEVQELIDSDPDEASRRLDEAIDAMHAVINDIRSFIFGLRPVLLEAGGLVDGLTQLAAELRRSSGVEVTVEPGPDAGQVEDLPIDVVAELLAVTREALSNIARHAQASHARVELGGSDAQLRMTISDDGKGFDVDQPIERGHLGLANMRSRIAGLSGTLEVDSDPGGTRIIVTLPRPGASAEEPATNR